MHVQTRGTSLVGALALAVAVLTAHTCINADERLRDITKTSNVAADRNLDVIYDFVQEMADDLRRLNESIDEFHNLTNLSRGIRTDRDVVVFPFTFDGEEHPGEVVGAFPIALAAATESAQTVRVFQLDFAEAQAVADVLATVLPDVRVSVEHSENRLVVALQADQFEAVSQTIQTLDKARQQVYVSGHLFEVAVEKLDQLGLQTEEIRALLKPGSELQPLIEALQKSEDARLLARPFFRSYDRVEVSFESVQAIPVQAFTRTGNGAIGTTDFCEVGISLTVTPRITADGSILMQVGSEYSKLQGYLDDQPIIDRRAATTTVIVRDGDPIIISGLRSLKQTRADESEGDDARDDTELLIILKAEIISDGEGSAGKKKDKTERG